MHPLFLTLIRRPDLVVDHISAYADLLTQEASEASHSLVNRVLLWLIAVISLAIAVVLVGTALMLGVLQNKFHWILVAVPGVMILCALVGLTWAKRPFTADHLSNIKSQFFSDAQALRVAAGHEAR
jgi:uncharacterized membrane protein YqjE